MTKRKKGCLIFLVVLLVAAAIIVWFQTPNRKLEIGKDTTFYTEPLLGDGRIDYITAINNKFSVGVTNDNNALIPLLDVINVADEYSPEYADELLRELGLGMVRPKYELDHVETMLDQLYPLTDETEMANRRNEFEQAYQPWISSDHPQWAEVLRKQSAGLDAVVEASKRTRYYLPLFSGESDEETLLAATWMPINGTLRTAARNLLIRTMSRLGDGDIDGAIEDAKTIRRLSRLIEQLPTLIDFFVSDVIRDFAFAAESQLVQADGITVEQLRSYREFLGEVQPNKVSVAHRLAISERCDVLDTILHGHRYGFESMAFSMTQINDRSPLGPGGLSILAKSADVNVALREVNRLFDDIVAKLDTADPRLRLESANAWETGTTELENRFTGVRIINDAVLGGPIARGKMLGQYLFLLLAPYVPQVFNLEVEREIADTLIYLAFSIELYKRSTGQYPDKLFDLQLHYIAEIPQDWFGTGTVSYRRTETGYVLYSIGEDKIDDEGLDSDESPVTGRGDIRVRVGELEK